jgi:tRNA (guanine-N7-)-methyltransferase
VFARSQPIEVDLGSGKGAFLLWAARTRPEVNFLGVDRMMGRTRKLAGKVERAQLTNVRLLRIEGSYFVEYLAPAGSISAYHIYFPDPWPKRRHHSRRLVQEEFVRSLRRSLVDGGVVNVATDHADYAEGIKETMQASGRFREVSPVAPPIEGRTDFEKQYLAAGLPIGRSRWIAR